MNTRWFRVLAAFLLFCAFSSLIAFQRPIQVETHLTDPFSAGWMLSDTNGDGIIDYAAARQCASIDDQS